ncbi:hypothetical protein A374_07459 [Fictibacillus macauensis ZFHKF-1]|uniref:DUF2254 domain-containing protein n=1 Tax=Fictibacillus macauensis ZFHKF-1 TaxID=1196324 RepID=I8UFI3_9BACL|nr:DUF2254 domain-containing protein [Fictibacillus macauensis]EIT85655.1 hypothetical protein A374_07459 [Fictibacillus macauensis ZFHKF-1]
MPSPFRQFHTHVNRYRQMSKRERFHQLHTNLWFTSLRFILYSLFLLTLSFTLDDYFTIGERSFFYISFSLTHSLVSTLTAGLLTLTTFTFNLVLVVFTTFSSQFSPRILKNFISNQATQRILGIFSGSFLYMLFSFFSLNTQYTKKFLAVPLTAVLLATLSMATFVFFIHHAVGWLQVNKMTDDMKNESLTIVDGPLQNEIQAYCIDDCEQIEAQAAQLSGADGTTITAPSSGYIQLIDFKNMISEAQQDQLILLLHQDVGEYVIQNTPIITYWKNGSGYVNKEKYTALFSIGNAQKEVQDIGFSINKLVEVAIRSLGNYDPKTTQNALNHLADLLAYLSSVATFNPYLVDENEQLRMITPKKNFSDYLYNSLGYIRHYAGENIIVGLEILKILKLIAKTASPRDLEAIWNFSVYTVTGYQKLFLFSLDRHKFNEMLYEIAVATNHTDDFTKIINGNEL